MSQVRTDAATPQAQAGPPGAVRARPLSPHLQIWRWHVTMAASIAMRVSGVGLYLGMLIVVALVVSLAMGPQAYASTVALLANPLGELVLFGITVCLFYHLAAGLRHLVWDTTLRGFLPRIADASAMFCFGFGLLAAVGVWVAAIMSGAA